VWAYHTQLDEVFQLASHLPNQAFVLDHVGGPLGVGPFSNRRPDVMHAWKASMRRLAQLDNLSVKIGGFGLNVLGFDFHLRASPPSSDELATAWQPYIDFVIETF